MPVAELHWLSTRVENYEGRFCTRMTAFIEKMEERAQDRKERRQARHKAFVEMLILRADGGAEVQTSGHQALALKKCSALVPDS